MNWKVILGLGLFAFLVSFGVWGFAVTIHNDAKIVARREALPCRNRCC